MSLTKAQKRIGKSQKKKLEQEAEKTERADVNIYYTHGEKPDQNHNAKIKIFESLQYSSRIEVNNEPMILDCSYQSTVIEKEIIGQSWLGWFAGALLFVGFDLYRMLHELLAVTWKVGLADALFLLVFCIPVFGWSVSLSRKTYKEINLIFDEQTGIYSSFVEKHQVLNEQESLQTLWILLNKLHTRIEKSKTHFWISQELTQLKAQVQKRITAMVLEPGLKEEDLERYALQIQSYISATIMKLDRTNLNPADIENAWKGLDDFLNIFESEKVEEFTEQEIAASQEEKKKLLTMIYEEEIQ